MIVLMQDDPKKRGITMRMMAFSDRIMYAMIITCMYVDIFAAEILADTEVPADAAP